MLDIGAYLKEVNRSFGASVLPVSCDLDEAKHSALSKFAKIASCHAFADAKEDAQKAHSTQQSQFVCTLHSSDRDVPL